MPHDAATIGPVLAPKAKQAARAGRKSLSLSITLDYWRDGRWYVGQLREVPEVVSQGRTLAKLQDNIYDAFHLILSDQASQRRKRARRLTAVV